MANGETIKVNTEFVNLCKQLTKKKVQIDAPIEVVQTFYQIYLDLKKIEPFKIQKQEQELLHSKSEVLLGSDVENCFNKLWNEGKFVTVLQNLEKFNWEQLTHAIMIYYTAKLRNMNVKEFCVQYKVDEESLKQMEIKLIKKTFPDN